ncbi:DNA alkylation repair protein [Luteolibacter arcticus]|uniref:DNA alkylation repair protein n=1 Tax=Luteolibacter arcticus TaxID=1581411 RepID=A0ABT3GGV9_9BACT|nr:DNA alkylation repair protein [Luteolibacter arcticus]MCW1922503.1 DNA alkylation repair protein [Luteolibacter arcticus]
MKLDEVMAELKAAGNEKVKKLDVRDGAGDNQYGVKSGDIRVLAKKLKGQPEHATELWNTGNADAMLLAVLLMNPKQITPAELEKLVRSVTFTHLADWLDSYVVKVHPQKESLREEWMKSSHPMTLRAGWSLTARRVEKEPEGLDLTSLLDRIEAEMGGAQPAVQWTMNYCLAQIGIHFPEHRKRALAIGEKLGVFRDYPTSKGCTSPFAPIWINEMVRRQG